MIGVVVPAHNEEVGLPACLRSLKAAAQHPELAGEDVQIVVVLDRCTDRTAAVAQAWQVTTLSLDAGNVGCARAAGSDWVIRHGARWLASTDADSRVPADWLVAQLACCADVFCGMVDVEDWQDYAPSVRDHFIRAHPLVEDHRHVHGANLGIDAHAYRRVGGFPALATGEDVAIVASLEALGARIARPHTPRVTTCARRDSRAPGGFGEYLRSLEARLEACSLGGIFPDPA